MKRVAIVVEGDSEVEFVKQALGPHLEAHGVFTAAMKPSGQGGNISVDRLAPVMAKLSWNFDAVTSLGRASLNPFRVDRRVVPLSNG